MKKNYQTENTIENIDKYFSEYRSDTKQYMQWLVDCIKVEHGNVPVCWNVSLRFIADNMETYFSAIQNIRDAGGYKEDERHRAAKNPNVCIANQAQDRTVKLLQQFALTPVTRSKMRCLNNVEDLSADDFVNNLIN